MNLLFNRIADMFPDAPFFYLSTSPWNVESSIRHFIANHGFPEVRCYCATSISPENVHSFRSAAQTRVCRTIDG